MIDCACAYNPSFSAKVIAEGPSLSTPCFDKVIKDTDFIYSDTFNPLEYLEEKFVGRTWFDPGTPMSVRLITAKSPRQIEPDDLIFRT